MKPTDYIRDQLVLAEHHVRDAAETKSEPVRESSLGDLSEIVGRIAKTLPKRDRLSIAHEKLQKEAELAQPSQSTKFTNTEGSHMPTHTANELRKMAEEAEARDRANAFELGFAKAANEAGLSEEQYQGVRAYGIELLKNAAETSTAELADRRVKKEEKREMTNKAVKKPSASC